MLTDKYTTFEAALLTLNLELSSDRRKDLTTRFVHSSVENHKLDEHLILRRTNPLMQLRNQQNETTRAYTKRWLTNYSILYICKRL